MGGVSAKKMTAPKTVNFTPPANARYAARGHPEPCLVHPRPGCNGDKRQPFPTGSGRTMTTPKNLSAISVIIVVSEHCGGVRSSHRDQETLISHIRNSNWWCSMPDQRDDYINLRVPPLCLGDVAFHTIDMGSAEFPTLPGVRAQSQVQVTPQSPTSCL